MPTIATLSPFASPPEKRSSVRMILGKTFFSLKRYLCWIKNSKSYALQRSENNLPYIVASHQTPLIRNLGADCMPLQHNKLTNFRVALPKLHGIMLNPGETFSFWRIVGKPTRKKGYVDGMVLHNGKCCAGLGGGLCQISNLIFWMTIHTPLTITERWRHNYDVFPDADRTQPFGSGATVVYNYVDLQIMNQTDYPYRLALEMNDHDLSGSWQSTYEPQWRYGVYESEHRIISHWWGGYTRKNTLKRRITDPEGTLISDELVCANEAIMMYEPLITGTTVDKQQREDYNEFNNR